MRCARIGNSSIVFDGVVFRGEQMLVKGELVYVYADPQTQTSKPVPQALRDTLLGFEQGEAMTTLQIGTWADLKPLTAPLRTEVFVDEQGVDQAMEWDSRDEYCLHAVLCNRLGLPVATGRLLPSVNGVAKIGRMAVKRVLRGQRLGDQVLSALMDAARARGDQQILLHAQCSAENFYRRQGFRRQGEVFMEANMAHVEMVCAL